MNDRKPPHIVVGWAIDVADNFFASEIHLKAMPKNADSPELYDLETLWLDLATLRRLHAEFSDLIAYMEKGGMGAGGKH